jgi:hypothetical protein
VLKFVYCPLSGKLEPKAEDSEAVANADVIVLVSPAILADVAVFKFAVPLSWKLADGTDV